MFSYSQDIYDAVYAFKDYAGEAEWVQGWIDRLAADPDGPLLDVACGTGSHLVQFKSNHDCEGLELDAAFVEIARKRTGVPIHQGDMRSFDLGKKFDALVCLFGSIGYTQTEEGLRSTCQCFADHLCRGGVAIIEPWFTPDAFKADHLGSVFVDHEDLKVARVHVSKREGSTSIIHFHYLVGRKTGVERYEESHVMGLFTHDQYTTALRDAGLDVRFDPEGPIGRGLFIATMS